MSRALDDMKFELREAKNRLRIPELWKRLGLPGDPKIGFNLCPFHREKSPSFHIFDDGRMFKCFGCAKAGDAVIFFEGISNKSRKEAVHEFIALAGGKVALRASAPAALPGASTPKTLRNRNRPTLPERTDGTPEQRAQLAKLRKLDIAAIEYAVELGTLSFCDYEGEQAWMLADESGVNAQVRKLDGGMFETASGPRKAKTLPASWAKWPIGVPPKKKRVIFAEGGPDFLAACQLCAEDVTLSPVCMFGSSCDIHASALPLLHGCDVFIVPHRDDAGALATARWSEQLKPFARNVYVSFLPELEHVKDLNDLLALPPAERGGWSL
jgi:hypothetical protein